MKTKIPLLLFLSILVFSCKRTPESPAPPLSPEKELLEFALKDSLNQPYLTETITAAIVGSEIKLAMSEAVDATNLVATFDFKGKAVYVDSVKQESGVTANDFTKPLAYVVRAEDGSQKSYIVKVELLPGLKPVLPHFYITTDNNAPISSKDHYIHGDLRIDGGGQYNDYQGRMEIRGRGNSTWKYPKKPYKIKLDSKAPLLGLYAHKKWILLANYLDGTLLLNSIPYTAARMLGMPFTNHIIPVEVTLNGDYQGFYVFTEQKEVNTHRIDVGDDGLLLELDVYYDESWKFKSDVYHLPVMIHYPELDDLPHSEAETRFQKIENDFNAFEKLVADPSFPNNDYLDFFSDTAYVDYMIVYQLTANREINFPKSTYIHKTKNGKYKMGIVWDFDWAFGYQPGTGTHFTDATIPVFVPGNSPGTVFFSRFMQDPHIKTLFKKRWAWFKANKYPQLKEYVKQYAKIAKGAYDRDHAKWGLRGSSGNLDDDLQQALNWLDARVNYVDGYAAGL